MMRAIQMAVACVAVLVATTGQVRGETISFMYTGAEQTWVVPFGVTSVTLEVWGAQGYTPQGFSVGGLGGYASGEIAVTPGETLYIYVGGAGTIANVTDTLMGGGFNGGGDGVVWLNGNGKNYAGGGGGASDIRLNSNSLFDRVLVAAGGGGATSNSGANGGDGGGLVGLDGEPGTGATQFSGGAIGGSFGLGGDAINNGLTGWVGGGGGGWYGGGASPAHYGGGGGSSYIGGVTNGFTSAGVNSGDGLVRLTFADVQAVPEPSSLALFGIVACVAGVGAARRRRREKQQEATA